MYNTLSERQIIDDFKGSIHCSQIVLRECAEDLGYDREEAARMAAPFGAGMFHGDTCGAVCGAMIAIGMRYGHDQHGDTEGNARMLEKVAEFQEKFIACHGSTICRDLLGYDYAVEGEFQKALEAGAVFERCPHFVKAALAILDEIL